MFEDAWFHEAAYPAMGICSEAFVGYKAATSLSEFNIFSLSLSYLILRPIIIHRSSESSRFSGEVEKVARGQAGLADRLATTVLKASRLPVPMVVLPPDGLA